MTKAYEVHPYCAAFPDIEGEEFDALREDLKMQGQQEPCWVYENWLLDGKNRQRALTANKQQVRYEKWAPVSKDEEQVDREIREFCISKNLRRRHLNESQRAMVAARLCPSKNGDERSPQGKFAPRQNSQKTSEIAESMNVSERSVKSATKVVEHAAPEIVHAVDVGQVSVSDAAKVAELPKKEQRAALKKVESGESSTLAKAAASDDKNQEAASVADAFGPVTGKLVPVFESVGTFKGLQKKLGSFQNDLEELQQSDAGAALPIQEMLNDLKDLKHALKFAIPYCECPKCRRSKKSCDTCEGLRWITEATFKRSRTEDDEAWLKGDRS